MRAYLAVIRMSFKSWLRSRDAVFWGVAFPLMLMGLMGFVFGRSEDAHFTVSVIDEAGDGLSQRVLEALADVSVFTVVEEDEAAALEGLRDGQRNLAIRLRPAVLQGGTPSAEYAVYYDESRMQTSELALAVLRRAFDEVNKQVSGRPDVIALQAEGVSGRSIRMFDYLLPGILAMTIMQTGLMGVTWTISAYRDEKVLKRVLSTPAHPFAFLAGLVSRFTLVNLLQAAIIVAVSIWVFKAQVAGSLLQLAALAAIGSVAFLAMGFAISTVTSNAEAANALGSMVNFPMLFLSGTFWPRELLPDAMQKLVGALPLTPLVEAMRDVSTAGGSAWAHWPGLLYLMAWGAAAMLLARWRFRWE